MGVGPVTKFRLRNSLSVVALVCAAAVALAPLNGLAQSPPAAAPAQSPAPAAQPAPDATAQQPQADQFTQAELRKLLAPIALYPDALLAQVLPASAYPIQIVQLQRWLDKNKAAVEKNDFSKIDAQSWDPAVKALARFPTVVKKMNDDLDWTTDLGDAVVNQPKDVADAIQYLRAQAEKAGALKSTPQQTVTRTKDSGREFIVIEPTDPGVVFVPTYDPAVVFDPGLAIATGLLTFGTGIAVASMWNRNYWNWGTGVIFPPVWPGYPGWRPPYPGWRPGVPPPPPPPGGWPGDRPGIGDRPGDRPGIGNRPGDRPGIGNRPGDRPGIGGGPGDRPSLPGGGNIGNDLKPWRPGGDYRPGLGSKPGIGERPTTRPAPGPGGGATTLPGGGAARPSPLPGGGPTTRPGGGAARPAPLPGANARPAPAPGGASRPATRPAPQPNRPAARPQGPRPPSGSAMSGIGMGPGNQMFSNRGAASRGQMGPPGGMRPGGGMGPRPGGMGPRPGGGMRPGGGGMGPRPGGGGGGAMRGGGGRRR